MMTRKECDGSSHGLFQGIIPALVWTYWEKPEKPSVWKAGNSDNVQTEFLPNTNPQHYCYTNLFGLNMYVNNHTNQNYGTNNQT